MPKRSQKPRNPYIAGGIVKEAEFVGRDEVLHSVHEYISQPDQNAILLTGSRRIGKTSILYKLRDELPRDQYVAVYFDLMGMANKKLSELLHLLAAKIAEAVEIPAPRKSKNFTLEGGFLEKVYTVIGEKRLVILLDEFDTLDNVFESPREEDFAANLFMEYVRNLLVNPGRLTFVFVLGRNLTDLSGKVHGLFKASLHQRVSVLTRAEAVRLVQNGERLGVLRFEEKAIDRILELTNGHPYFTQIVCHTAFQRAWGDTLDDEQIPVVTAELVDEIVPDVLVVSSSAFEWIWEGIPPAEKIVLSTLAHLLPRENSTATRSQISKMLDEKRLRVLTGELKIAPDNLVKWEILRKLDDDHYCFFVEIFRRWIQSEKKLDQVSREINRVNPRAEAKFRAAQAAHSEGDFKAAVADYREAIRLNPAHIDARIGLARALFEDGMVDQAIEEYEAAYEYDPKAIEEFLVPILFSRAAARETGEALIEALNDYERILQIDKENGDALQKKASVIARLGDIALEEGRIEEAGSYYTAVGLTADREIRIQAKRTEQMMQKQEQQHQQDLQKMRRDTRVSIAMAILITLFIATCGAFIFGLAEGFIAPPAFFWTDTPVPTWTPTVTPTFTSIPTATLSPTAIKTSTRTHTPGPSPTPTHTSTPWPSLISLSPGRFQFVDASHDGQYIVIASGDGSIALWEADPNRRLREIDSKTLGFPITQVEFSPDGAYVIVAGYNDLFFYERDNLSIPVRKLKVEQKNTFFNWEIRPSGSSRHVATVDSKGNLRIRDWDTGFPIPLPQIEGFQFSRIRDIAYASDGSAMAIIKQDLSIWIWDLSHQVQKVDLSGYEHPYENIQWQNDVLSASYYGTSSYTAVDYVVLWDTTTLTTPAGRPRQIYLGDCSNCTSYILSDDGSLIVKSLNWSTQASGVRFYDAQTGKELITFDAQCTSLRSFAYVGNKRELVTVGDPGCAHILLLPEAISTPIPTATQTSTLTPTFTATATFTPRPTRTPTPVSPTATFTLPPLQP